MPHPLAPEISHRLYCVRQNPETDRFKVGAVNEIPNWEAHIRLWNSRNIQSCFQGKRSHLCPKLPPLLLLNHSVFTTHKPSGGSTLPVLVVLVISLLDLWGFPGQNITNGSAELISRNPLLRASHSTCRQLRENTDWQTRRKHLNEMSFEIFSFSVTALSDM
jgi:hypothetical protein